MRLKDKKSHLLYLADCQIQFVQNPFLVQGLQLICTLFLDLSVKIHLIIESFCGILDTKV